MKKLTREERLGAIVLGIVSVLAIGGGVWWKSNSNDVNDVVMEVKIPAPADSVSQGRGGLDPGESGSSHNRKNSKPYKHRKKKRVTKQMKESRSFGIQELSQRRDFLADTIPVAD